MEKKNITRDNAVINYNIYGDGETTLLFVHGSYINQTYWDEQVKYFKENYTVVTFDLPGQGKSGKERTNWSMQGFADDVIEVVKVLALKKVILIGHSMGSDINLIAATKQPSLFIGFIVVDNFKNVATPLPKEFEKQIATIEENLKKDFPNANEQYARMALLTPKTPAAITDRVVKNHHEGYKPMGLPLYKEIFGIWKTEKELLPKLNFKLYLINVNYHPTNEEPLKEHAKNGYELINMVGTSHYPMIENPDLFNKNLDETIHKILGKDKLVQA